uniref:6,7-dimethyl-8-ribityllumazine synthase n=1 Tax=Thermogemmatispora argillosa TaxID=2045280 RepID=A0A455T1Y3_9CHLR|nr:6,7-dimethyl-8-ribityllumazine synthase [Thermogemmatispora argillosa]
MSEAASTEERPAGRGLRIALAVARYHPQITGAMQELARCSLIAHGVAAEDIDIWHAPGSFELPLLAQALATSQRYDAIICLGCVMKGETRHDVLVGDAAARGLQRVALESGLPIIFGVICASNRLQAQARIPRAAECALAAIELVGTLRRIRSSGTKGAEAPRQPDQSTGERSS